MKILEKSIFGLVFCFNAVCMEPSSSGDLKMESSFIELGRYCNSRVSERSANVGKDVERFNLVLELMNYCSANIASTEKKVVILCQRKAILNSINCLVDALEISSVNTTLIKSELEKLKKTESTDFGLVDFTSSLVGTDGEDLFGELGISVPEVSKEADQPTNNANRDIIQRLNYTISLLRESTESIKTAVFSSSDYKKKSMFWDSLRRGLVMVRAINRLMKPAIGKTRQIAPTRRDTLYQMFNYDEDFADL